MVSARDVMAPWYRRRGRESAGSSHGKDVRVIDHPQDANGTSRERDVFLIF
jgi:hypothetical protein